MILVSGGSGFIGARLARALRSNGSSVRTISRRPGTHVDDRQADLADPTGLAEACAGVDVVFHCAGHAHAFSSLDADQAAVHWRVNFEGTKHLLAAASAAGARKFIFLSTVKAMAEPGESCAGEDWPGIPDTDYGRSKREAEGAVLAAAAATGMHVVVLRLCMVYGRGGRGNLERMGALIGKGLFPPLPETGNRRSMIHVDDVVNAMICVADAPQAAGKIYILAGDDAPSGRALYDALRSAMALDRVTWSVPKALLRTAAQAGDIAGRLLRRRMPLDSEVLDRLLKSAWYSSEKIRRELGWHPKVNLRDGLKEMLGR